MTNTRTPEAERTTGEVLNGKRPWEFACKWYREEEVARSIAGGRRRLVQPTERDPVPEDIYSPEFAYWLTNQYRLAMTKGIELGQRNALATAVNSRAALVGALEKNVGKLCLVVGGLRDAGMFNLEAVAKSVLDDSRAALAAKEG